MSEHFNDYYNSIKKIPLLTAEEEVKLGHQIQAMMKVYEEGKEAHPDFASIIRQGKWAKEKMIRSNLRLVVAIANKYKKGSLLDSIQEGNLGLIRAVEKFDPTKGFKFSTYAQFWIRQQIIRSKSFDYIIRLPQHILEKHTLIHNTESLLSIKLDRKPTLQEISEEVGLSTEMLKNYYRLSKGLISLDAQWRIGDDSVSLYEVLEDKEGITPDLYSDRKDLENRVETLISCLKPNEAKVIKLNFGIDSNQELTYEKIGKKLNVCRERVRQIKGKSLRKLRCAARKTNLKDYLKDY